jgi:mRNA interferase MazF
MVIQQGDVVWVDLPPARGSAPAGRRPAVVLQHDRYNRSRINTAVVAAITSNLAYAGLPGNVRLRKGEAGLPSPSVVNVTQIATVDRAEITARAGQLSPERLLEVWGGVRLVLAPATAPA